MPPDANWKDSLPPEIKASPALKDVADIPSLAKQFIDQQSYLGNAIRVPGEDAGEEDRKEFHKKLMDKVPGLIPTPNIDDPEMMGALYRKLGQPEKEDGYKLPEGVKEDDAKTVRKAAFEAGLTQKQFNKLMSDISLNKTRVDSMTLINRDAAIKNLRQEWGIAYEDRISQVQVAMVATGAPKELQAAVIDGSAGPDTIKWLHGIYKQLGPEGLNIAKGGPGSNNATLTPQEAQIQINEILNNRNHDYWKATSPYHQDAKARMVKLHEMAFPETDFAGVRRAAS